MKRMALLGIGGLVALVVQPVFADVDCGVLTKAYGNAASAQEQYRAGMALEKSLCMDDAMVFLRKAAGAGLPEALLQVGLIVQGGDGGHGHTRADPRKAFGYFMRAAELGNSDAMVMVALHYEKGTAFLPRDMKKAWEWYVKAAAHHNQLAAERVAKAYRNGELGQNGGENGRI